MIDVLNDKLEKQNKSGIAGLYNIESGSFSSLKTHPRSGVELNDGFAR